MARCTCRSTVLITFLAALLVGWGCTRSVDYEDPNDDSNPVDTTDSAMTWQLVWQDDFNGDAGKSPDSNRWDYDIGTNWGNDQLEYDTDRPTNVSLDGSGHLAIVAREESYEADGSTYNYTAARIVTRDLFEPTYGRIEARIKLPVGQGIWPAFWMLGTNVDAVSWPQCGEIDIMEYRGQEPQVVLGSLHGPGYSGAEALSRRFYLENDRFDNGFHVFAVEWKANEIRWFVDDIEFLTADPSKVSGDWVFNHPFYMILNVAVGGNFVGSPDETTVFPQTMLIDYVRVYRQRT